LQRIGKGNQLIVHGQASHIAKPSAPLIRSLARAHQLQHRLLRASTPSIENLAASANLNRKYTIRLLRLSRLAPDITEAILQGHQPPSL